MPELQRVGVAVCGGVVVWKNSGVGELRLGKLRGGIVTVGGGVAVWGEVTVCKESRCGGFIIRPPWLAF